MDATAVSSTSHRGPLLDFAGLDILWIQVAGTLCNIACRHCFISCGPKNDSHALMDTRQIESLLERARELGVKEYYFTGGEPFLHPQIEALIARVLAQGPLTILTNGMLIDEARAQRLAELQRASRYSLELRVSLDGASAAENDPIRGHGSFDEILGGARALDRAGLFPVFSITTVHTRYECATGRSELIEALGRMGFRRPRVKTIPPFLIGREATRGGAYAADHLLDEGDLSPGAERTLQCGHSRTVSSKGVFPCPILIEEDGAQLASDLDDALVPLRLNHPACRTCHVEGFSCRT